MRTTGLCTNVRYAELLDPHRRFQRRCVDQKPIHAG